ncbi:nitroreductase family protein [Myxococcota bacterium]|nr:nitroreductase family protein [Myxococcota bacterium]
MDTESIDEVLRTTRSVRRRLDFEREVPPEVIEECIEIATQAPTGLNRESWRFLIITDPKKKAAIARLYRAAFEAFANPREGAGSSAQRALVERLHEMPALILVCSLGNPPGSSNAMNVGFYGSVLPAAWSLMLALRARGIGATWTTVLLVHERESAELLGIPEGVTQTVLLPIGYTRDAVLRPANRRGADEVSYWNQWGRRRDEN